MTHTNDQDRIESLAFEIRDALLDLSPRERVQVFGLIHELYCPECGDKQPAVGTCQCWNDE